MPRKTTSKKAKPTASKRVQRAARTLMRATTRATKRAKRVIKSAGRRKAPPRATTARAGQADAVALLKADHKQLLSWLEELKTTQAAGRRDRLLKQVEDALKTHTTIEEEIFYPAFRDAAMTERDRKMFYEALEEHHAVDTILPEVKSATGRPEVFAARAKVLNEMVEHHASEEETEMFPRARKLLPSAELRRLGAEMAARKRSLLKESGGPLAVVTALFSS